MATRCNVIVEDQYNKIQLYRHCDGYPESIIPDLTQALHYAWELSRFEASDFAAAIVRAWKENGGGNIYIDGSPKAFELVHGDVEWVYVVEFDQKKREPIIKVYDWHFHWFDKSDTTMKSFRPRPKMIIPFGEIPTDKLMA